MKQQDQAQNLEALYPELGAGGFSRDDGTIDFYARINALIHADMTVLDVGAGRGAQLLDTAVPYRSALATLKGKVKKLVGVDVDEGVLENDFLDEAHVTDPAGPLPFEDGLFDLIYADWVLEHVSDPAMFVAEAHRVLKSGGWFCARTPNRWGVTGVAANLIPNQAHSGILKHLQPFRKERDVFPTVYRMNTKRSLNRLFDKNLWRHFTYLHNPEPPYVQGSKALMLGMKFYFRATPRNLATNLHVFCQKR